MKKIKTALISVSDKSYLSPLLKSLKKNNIKIISSGGTYKEIKKLKFKCLEVSEFTNSPEILEGRVKTLHPKIHAGILNKRNNKIHIKDLKNNNFENIDLVIVNFYPFEKTLNNSKNHEKIIENIDVGGPTMVRSAAKNYQDVTVITSSDQYNELIDELNRNKGSTSLEFREKLARIAFTETAYYDSVISDYFNKKNNIIFPKRKIFHTNLIETPRYGENPHQKSAIYSKNNSLKINQIHGKQLSYNNYNDIFSALTISKSLPKNTGTVIVKHANPCGVSINKDNIKSYKLALACDPVSAFGGIVSCNFKIKKNLAIELNKLFLEVIIANGFDKEALKLLKKKKNLRLVDATNYSYKEILRLVSSNEEFLVQTEDFDKFSMNDFKVVSKKKPNT
ncbi:MAG: bifunctional phosphoribosylaminoimidazolecarboxamide formyltransferase/IMP cyclohydrolase, partial [Candidatus Pelagibacter sp.]